MVTTRFINHSIDDLYELRLLGTQECTVLRKSKFIGLYDILAHYRTSKTFRALPGCGEGTDGNLKYFCDGYIKRESEELSFNDLFQQEFKQESFYNFIPEIIDWPSLKGYKRAFLDTYIHHALARYHRKPMKKYFEGRLGQNTDAESFYENAILHPFSEMRKRSHSRGTFYLGYLISSFINYHRATRIIFQPLDLLYFLADYEFRVEKLNEIKDFVSAWSTAERFPMANTTYQIASRCLYFHKDARWSDILPLRYATLLQKRAADFSSVAKKSAMPPSRFKYMKRETDRVTCDVCSMIIDTCKSLGFKDYYRSLPGWNDRYLTFKFVDSINTLEQVNLPISFYALLFRQLYDLRFEPTKIPKGKKKEIHYFNASGKES